MRVLVDADACPVREIIVRLCREKHIPLVMVTPSDTALINESGEERRRYMNSLISQLDRKYLATLVRYNHLLAERNKLLKAQQTPNFSEIMEVIDLQMAALGTDINAGANN